MNTGDPLQMRMVGPRRRCPCGKSVRTGESVPEGKSFVMHDVPVCGSFMELEAEPYLTWLESVLERTQPAKG